MVCELYLSKAVTKKTQMSRSLRSVLGTKTSGASRWPQLCFWPTGLHPLTIWLPVFIWPGMDSCHFPSLSLSKILLVSKLWSGAIVLSEVKAVSRGPWQVLAQTPARFSLLASLHGKVCMGSFLPAHKGSQEATIQLHFFTLPFGNGAWSRRGHVGLCTAQLEEASLISLPLWIHYKTFPAHGRE